MSLPEVVAKLARRISDLERRLENTVRQGTVKEVDTERQRVRLVIGKGPGGEEQLSAWVPYGQQAGALKIHAPPSPGQNMTLVAPGGDLEQAIALPMTWNDGNPSPSSSAAENMLTFGDVAITVTGSSVTMTVGGHSVTLTANGTDFGGGHVRHNAKHIDDHHQHVAVMPGGGTSGPPA